MSATGRGPSSGEGGGADLGVGPAVSGENNLGCRKGVKSDKTAKGQVDCARGDRAFSEGDESILR